MRIFHIVTPSVWAAAATTYVPAGFDADGFVHFSFAGQVARTANAIYRDEPELIVVEVESDDVPAELRVEDSYGSGEEFPHVYGPVPVAAAVATRPLRRDADGDWTFSPGPATGSASTDR
ncbi:MAG: DUF952 domain-containing protein [Jatrophihabitantaceae bacterium]